MAFKKWVQNIQTTGYNGAHMICNTILEPKFWALAELGFY